ncbi:winged helix-turn-helix domain-containing protein [Nonomuraea sp. NPDC050556]|uniref:AfsR/SARP family transcriptional regulator n=1 Tax=Nonomuraea sp. NPDC050556 TaxID=3364369 RepID=UPI0037B85B6E
MMFSVLGPVRAWVGGREVPLGPPQQRLFLAALVLARGQVVGQRTLIDQLWDGEPPRSATQVLRTYVSRLRGLLGAATIASLGDGWAISGGTSDLDRFDELCTAKQWREALDLWQGDALDGLTGTYAETQRTRLAERRRLAEEQLADPNRPAQLPADLADFTGRDRLVADLAETLEPGATVAISAVAGIGGVGKTALAVHVAHLVRQSFPDGQLFADLRGAGG